VKGWRSAAGPLRVCAAAGALEAAALAALSLAPHHPALLWNATASAPLGFYRLTPLGAPRVGEKVALRPRGALAAWIVARGYAPADVPLLKQVAAVGGQTVCREGDRVTVDGRLAARALAADRRGAPLPAWRACVALGAGEVFLLNPPPDSLDGRYFGPSRVADLVGRAEPLWTWGAQR
jgi:conjugative transfer signal peptidase TraF